jgi:hypothetical protein
MPIIVVSDSPRHQQRTEFLVPVFPARRCQVLPKSRCGEGRCCNSSEQVDAGKRSQDRGRREWLINGKLDPGRLEWLATRFLLELTRTWRR